MPKKEPPLRGRKKLFNYWTGATGYRKPKIFLLSTMEVTAIVWSVLEKGTPVNVWTVALALIIIADIYKNNIGEWKD